MWCSAHLHCHFRVNYPGHHGGSIEFQSCDKPIPNRRYFDVFEVTKENTLNRNFRSEPQYQVKNKQDSSADYQIKEIDDPKEHKDKNETNETSEKI